MSSKNRFSFQLSEFLLIIFVLFSGVMLAFNTGSFVVNFKTIGFTVISSIERGIHSVTDSVHNTVCAVSELGKLRRDYEELSKKL